MLLATFIFHEEWIIDEIPPTCPLAQSWYFAFYKHYPNRFSFVKTNLPWQDDPDCPVTTGIPIHCSLIDRLMNIHKMWNKLPGQIMNMIIKKLDDRSMGEDLLIHQVSFSPLKNQIMT